VVCVAKCTVALLAEDEADELKGGEQTPGMAQAMNTSSP